MQTKDNLILCISKATHLPTRQICMSTNIREDLNLDSLDFLLVILKVENYFQFSMNEEQIAKIETVKDLFKIIPPQAMFKFSESGQPEEISC